jgi:hypothetical protein
MARGARKAAAVTLKIGKNAIAAFAVKPVQLVFKERFEIHRLLPVQAHDLRAIGNHVFDLHQFGSQ